MKLTTLALGGLGAYVAYKYLFASPAVVLPNTGGAAPPNSGGAGPAATGGGAKPAGQVFLVNAGISCAQWLMMSNDARVVAVLSRGVAPMIAQATVNTITASCASPLYGYPYWWGWGGGFRGHRGGHGGHWGGGGGHWGGGGHGGHGGR